MRQFTALLFACVTAVHAQTYVPFPTDTAIWNGQYRWTGSPNPGENYTIAYRHALGGDTLINGISYKKLLYCVDGFPCEYHGALREDASRNIWIFPPPWSIVIGDVAPQLPNDQAERLLYTFNNLSVGMSLPLGMDPSTLIVTGIDSVVVQGSYRKRYTVQNSNLLQEDHWIEGIGSTVDLLSPFLFEFEWAFYTLCFQAPGVAWENPDDQMAVSCDLIMATPESTKAMEITAVPNPGTDLLVLRGLPPATTAIELHDAMGRLALRAPAPLAAVDVSGLPTGVYSISLLSPAGRQHMPGLWVKE